MKAGAIPTGQLAPGVVGLAVLHVRHQDWAERSLPAGIGVDHLRLPIGILYVQLSFQTKSFAVLVLSNAADIAAKPTVPENGADRVAALAEHLRHIVAAVVDAFTVISPPRHEDLIAYPRAVEVQFEEALR